MPAQLLALTDGPSIVLDKPILLLGRHAECDLQLNSRKVSRRHCCVAAVKDYLVIRDLGSTNGIRINGERVAEGRLKAGDELTIGNFRYQVYMEGAPAPAPAVPAPKKPASPKPADESLIESSEEPIALEDSSTKAKKAATAKAPPVKAFGVEYDDSFVLPEKLRAAPPPDRRG